MEPGRDGDVELREGRHMNIGLCSGVSDGSGVGSSVGVDGTDSVCIGGSLVGGSGNSDGAGSVT